MKRHRLFKRLVAGGVLAVLAGVALWMPSGAQAVSLGAGDYALTSGDMTGSTFTIGPSGVFTAWDLTFPTSPTVTFASSLPPPVY
jgi:hypothetical protein